MVKTPDEILKKYKELKVQASKNEQEGCISFGCGVVEGMKQMAEWVLEV